MITCPTSALETDPWQRELAGAISDVGELLALLGLRPEQMPRPPLGDSDFPLRVTRYFAGLMRPGDPDDPLLAQVLPLAAENRSLPGFGEDPVGDLDALLGRGVLQKYRGRALLVATGACAVHCRYCFRRHFPYSEQSVLGSRNRVDELLNANPEIDELILSGGDPLSLSDQRLAQLVEDAGRAPRLRRLRIHTRLPVVLPSRITPRLARLLADSGLAVSVVIHANHPNELTPQLAAALQILRDGGVQLLNQSVLLKSVNDDADTLVTLSEALFDIGVLPYYLHLLDPVAGAAHFEVAATLARDLERELWARLPGYLVPRVVREVAGAPGKTPLARL